MILLILFSIDGFSQNNNSKIEIYLPNHFVQSEKDSKKFWIDSTDLEKEPIVLDSQIWGYDTLTYEIFIDTIACEKFRELKPALPIGIQFALTVDKMPIITGYIWNPVSSFGCDWYMIPNICSDRLKIYKGGPENLNKDLPELRNSPKLINAVIQTNRLMNLDYSKVKCAMPTISTDKISYLINGVQINEIEFINIDTSKVEQVVVIKDKSKQDLYEKLNGTIEIKINKKYFSNLKLRDFFSANIISDNLVNFVLDNKEVNESQVMDSKLMEYKEILFEIENKKVFLITKNNK